MMTSRRFSTSFYALALSLGRMKMPIEMLLYSQGWNFHPPPNGIHLLKPVKQSLGGRKLGRDLRYVLEGISWKKTLIISGQSRPVSVRYKFRCGFKHAHH